jgi:hypothetical protein
VHVMSSSRGARRRLRGNPGGCRNLRSNHVSTTGSRLSALALSAALVPVLLGQWQLSKSGCLLDNLPLPVHLDSSPAAAAIFALPIWLHHSPLLKQCETSDEQTHGFFLPVVEIRGHCTAPKHVVVSTFLNSRING